MKTKTLFFCTHCGADSPKWIGKCPACGQWNTYVEETISRQPSTSTARMPSGLTAFADPPARLCDITPDDETRIDLRDGELNRVLGGGLVKGSLVLIGGEPGIGKSTLVLQAVLALTNMKTLYVSGEESSRQLKLRAERLSSSNVTSDCFIFCETNLDQIFAYVQQLHPALLIIDSIQTVYVPTVDSSPGSLSQIRESASLLLRYAKQTHTPILLIGHINKEGSIAGPKILEHIVDTVLQFEGDQQHLYRILRSIKNRFGSTSELGIYEMQHNGLRPVANPSELLLTQNHGALSGCAIAAAIEGIRPFLIETQALVGSAVYGTPQRSSTGFDIRRLNMLLAVLEKRAGFKIMQKDVFLNIAGGLRVCDPAIDLSILVAILSSALDIPLGPSTAFAGEVGLSGEVRPVTRIEQRLHEAVKLGFTRILIPSGNLKSIVPPSGLQIYQVAKVEDALRILFGKELSIK
ncbi:MAG: DNA repair protein RadA [Tannerellaceae bacterium]|jgi:DNA repair protein RadA/Sms|nr:DNA repair protein RadA [Tannerellaceae bacterium]